MRLRSPPREENCNRRTGNGAAVSLAGSMRRMVAIRENGLYRRQADDEHPRSVRVSVSVRLRFFVCGFYGLCGCTDESSVSSFTVEDHWWKSRVQGASRATFVCRSAVPGIHSSAHDTDLQQGLAGWGWP